MWPKTESISYESLQDMMCGKQKMILVKWILRSYVTISSTFDQQFNQRRSKGAIRECAGKFLSNCLGNSIPSQVLKSASHKIIYFKMGKNLQYPIFPGCEGEAYACWFIPSCLIVETSTPNPSLLVYGKWLWSMFLKIISNSKKVHKSNIDFCLIYRRFAWSWDQTSFLYG